MVVHFDKKIIIQGDPIYFPRPNAAVETLPKFMSWLASNMGLDRLKRSRSTWQNIYMFFLYSAGQKHPIDRTINIL